MSKQGENFKDYQKFISSLKFKSKKCLEHIRKNLILPKKAKININEK